MRAKLDVDLIYLQPEVEFYERGQEVLDRYPEAERVIVDSHWRIPALREDEELVPEWNRVKRTTLVLGVRKSMPIRPNGRSADFIAPGHANGCAMACAYCYVARRKGTSNPISVFVNDDEILQALRKHAEGLLAKEPNQTDPRLWTYDIGEGSDCSVDATVCGSVRALVEGFRTIPNAKATFATKAVNDEMLSYDPQGKTRIRFSLMPGEIARRLDVRTDPVGERIAAIDPFLEAGYEVHVNFSPVVLYDGWERDWRELFRQIDDTISDAAKAQLKAEVIFLTHSPELHETNLRWHPKAEELLWRPEIQEPKEGSTTLRYRRGFKGEQVRRFREILAEEMPYCAVRYAF
ncbi:spore photoproduct lyase family protein [bacterium]|nr:MAG: spore photoproduct lyase family protein [bacterium]